MLEIYQFSLARSVLAIFSLPPFMVGGVVDRSMFTVGLTVAFLLFVVMIMITAVVVASCLE